MTPVIYQNVETRKCTKISKTVSNPDNFIGEPPQIRRNYHTRWRNIRSNLHIIFPLNCFIFLFNLFLHDFIVLIVLFYFILFFCSVLFAAAFPCSFGRLPVSPTHHHYRQPYHQCTIPVHTLFQFQLQFHPVLHAKHASPAPLPFSI